MLNQLNSKYFSIWSDKYLDWRCWTLSHMNLKRHLISWSPNAYASCSHLCLLITWQAHFSLYIFKTLTLHVHQMHMLFFFWRFYHCWNFFVKICLVNQFHALQITLTNKDCDMEIKLWKNKTLSLLKLHRNIVAWSNPCLPLDPNHYHF